MIGLLNTAARAVQDSLSYLQQNAWYIVMLVAVLYTVKNSYLDNYLKNRNYRPDAQRVSDYREDMMRVRLAQQELANERAKEAAKNRKEEEAKEKERKNNVAKPKPKPGGSRLGESTTNSYSPLQPWSSSSGGYKPTRRTVRRG